MDFGKVLSRAWEITWRWKVLWIFGFLASLGQGWGSGSPTYSVDSQDFNMEGWGQGPPEAFWPAIGGVVVAIICVLFILTIVLWIVSIISRGALIAGVVQVENEGETSFRQAWAVGFQRFWTLFGLAVLAALPILVLVIVGLILFGLGIAGGVGLMEIQEAAGIGTIVMVSLVFGCLLCCGLVVLGIVLEQIRVYGERAAILEGLGWIDAFQRGWQVIKENLGPTIVLWLIFFVLGLIIVAISIGLMLLLFAPFLVLVGVTDTAAWSLVPILCGGALALILFALVRSVLTTFVSASWTLAFRELAEGTALAKVENVSTWIGEGAG
jgi:hypothetical protein